MVPKAKPKAASLLALKPSKDAEFRKKSIKNRKTLKTGKKWLAGQEVKRGVIYLSRIPYGFFEAAMLKFFRQFGVVKNIILARSKKTGASCGYAYIEFEHYEVAKIVAKIMDGYLTFGKIMKCQIVPPERVSDKLFADRYIRPRNCPRVLSRTAAINQLNKRRTLGQARSRRRRLADAYRQKMDVLNNLGISLDLGLPGVKLQSAGNDINENSDADKIEMCEENVELTEEQRAEFSKAKKDLTNKIKVSLKRMAKTKKGKKMAEKATEDMNLQEPVNGTEPPTNPPCKAVLSTKKSLGRAKKTSQKIKKLTGKGLVCKKIIKMQNTLEERGISNDESASENQVSSAGIELNGKKSPINRVTAVKRKLNNNQTQTKKSIKRIKAVPVATGSDSQSLSAVKRQKNRNKSPTDASKSEITQIQTEKVHLPKAGKKNRTLKKAKTLQKRKILKITSPKNTVIENVDQTPTLNSLKVSQSPGKVQMSVTPNKSKTPKKDKTVKGKINKMVASSDSALRSTVMRVAQSTEDLELSSTPKRAKMPEEVSVPANNVQLSTNLDKSVMPKKRKMPQEAETPKKAKTPKKKNHSPSSVQTPKMIKSGKVMVTPKILGSGKKTPQKAKTPKKFKTPKKAVTPEEVLPLKKIHSPSFVQTPKMIKSKNVMVTPKILGSGKKTKLVDKKLMATKKKFKLSTPLPITPRQKIKTKAPKSA
ncbi:neurofilament heavy polypeptide [Procambarus clarkii]|uniref:neurofilament heavy polypeptide n=1 Tax=Procambarus clarkii TaxID=6728 RepID=UPI00374359DC